MFWQSFRSFACVGASLLLLTAGWMSGSSSAAIIFLSESSVKLSTLINNPSAEMIAGDKRFTGFGYDFSGDMPNAEGVNVRPILDDLGDNDPATGNYGLRFQGAFLDLASTPNGSDALITYMVEATRPGYLISDAHLAGNPALLGPYGSISVTETFLPLGGSGEHTMRIFDDESAPTPKLVDWTYFNPPVKKLNVQKDILAKAVTVPGAPGSTVTLSFVDQTYSQIVPEPATVAMSLIAAVGITVCLRRRNRQ